jgi:hypothetical protein
VRTIDTIASDEDGQLAPAREEVAAPTTLALYGELHLHYWQTLQSLSLIS